MSLTKRRSQSEAARVIASVATLVVLAACAPPAALPAPEPVVDAPRAPAVDVLAAPWIPTFGAGPFQHELRTETELVSRVDTLERRDSLRTVLGVEWTRLAGDGAPRLSGLITTYGISIDTAPPAPIAGTLLPMPFAALDGVASVPARLTRPDPAACSVDAAIALGVRDLLLTLPRRLDAGTTWSDSTSLSVCRDSIPLVMTSARDYRVLGAERRRDAVVVLVERRSRVTLRGEGAQFGERIAIEASGEGTMRLAVQLAGARILEGDGEQSLRMTMRGRRRSQELTQRTRMTITTP